MSKISSKLTQRDIILSVYVPAIASFVTAIGVIYQIFAPTTPQIVSDGSIIEENRRLLAEKELLESEKGRLETELQKLEDQISAIDKKKGTQVDERQAATDYWIVTALKTVVVYISLVFSAVLTFYTFVGDLVVLPFGYSFCLTRGLWGFVWSKLTIGWYWEQARWYGVVAGGILLVAVSSMSSKSTGKKEHA